MDSRVCHAMKNPAHCTYTGRSLQKDGLVQVQSFQFKLVIYLGGVHAKRGVRLTPQRVEVWFIFRTFHFTV